MTTRNQPGHRMPRPAKPTLTDLDRRVAKISARLAATPAGTTNARLDALQQNVNDVKASIDGLLGRVAVLERDQLETDVARLAAAPPLPPRPAASTHKPATAATAVRRAPAATTPASIARQTVTPPPAPPRPIARWQSPDHEKTGDLWWDEMVTQLRAHGARDPRRRP